MSCMPSLQPCIMDTGNKVSRVKVKIRQADQEGLPDKVRVDPKHQLNIGNEIVSFDDFNEIDTALDKRGLTHGDIGGPQKETF